VAEAPFQGFQGLFPPAQGQGGLGPGQVKAFPGVGEAPGQLPRRLQAGLSVPLLAQG